MSQEPGTFCFSDNLSLSRDKTGIRIGQPDSNLVQSELDCKGSEADLLWALDVLGAGALGGSCVRC